MRMVVNGKEIQRVFLKKTIGDFYFGRIRGMVAYRKVAYKRSYCIHFEETLLVFDDILQAFKKTYYMMDILLSYGQEERSRVRWSGTSALTVVIQVRLQLLTCCAIA